jgi:uncharacterized protein (DUF433 family)
MLRWKESGVEAGNGLTGRSSEIADCISLRRLTIYRLTIDPNKRSGKPCVRGLRITVYEVLEYLASNMTEEEILDDFPDLTREDLKACIAFAADRERKLVTVPAE